MKGLYTATAVATLLISSISFAADQDAVMDTPSGASCGAIAKACKAGGFERGNEGKRFWKDCMRPIILGKSVTGITVDADKVKACRDKKIAELQDMLAQLQAVK